MEIANKLGGDDKLGSEVAQHFPSLTRTNTAQVNTSVTDVDDLTYVLLFSWKNKSHTHSRTDPVDFALFLNQ